MSAPLRKEDERMDISVNIETKKIPISIQHNRIFDKFRENRLLPLIKIVRAVEADGEIIDVFVMTVRKNRKGRYHLIARQIEIIRELKMEDVEKQAISAFRN